MSLAGLTVFAHPSPSGDVLNWRLDSDLPLPFATQTGDWVALLASRHVDSGILMIGEDSGIRDRAPGGWDTDSCNPEAALALNLLATLVSAALLLRDPSLSPDDAVFLASLTAGAVA